MLCEDMDWIKLVLVSGFVKVMNTLTS